MKLKKIRVSEFTHIDGFGPQVFQDVEILFDPNENEITSDNFNQKKHSFFLSDDEIERLSRESAQRFYDENGSTILSGDRRFKKNEVSAIKEFFRITGAELGDLIGLHKSSISRVLSGKQVLESDKSMLLLERLRDELEHPGKSKITLHIVREGISGSTRIKQVCIPALNVAEFFVRNFVDKGRPITHLKLQKLLYYAQGIGFGRANIKLFKEPLEAWEHGPVIRDVYAHYKKFGDSPLQKNENTDLMLIYADAVVMNVLEETLSRFGMYEAWHLREKTHRESPWSETERNQVITDKAMIRFFRKALV